MRLLAGIYIVFASIAIMLLFLLVVAAIALIIGASQT